MSQNTPTNTVEDIPQRMGPRLLVAREQAGFTQAQFARQVGVLLESVVAWENDEKQPRANRLMMICGVLNVSVKWLLEGIEDAHMARDDDSLAAVRLDFARLQELLKEMTEVARDLETRLSELEQDTDWS